MNIYIGNLSYEVTEEDLKQAFETFGEVESVKILKTNTLTDQKDLDSLRYPIKPAPNPRSTS